MSYKNSLYLKFVRSLPCASCGSPSDDAHHAINMKMNLSGMAITAPDHMAIPTCRPCHQTIHASPELQRLQPEWLESTWSNALRFFGMESEVGIRIREARRHMRAQLKGVAA